MRPFVIALAGNPNTGKTTLFNRLTGARERVGNWSGVTVERAEEALELAGRPARIVDLPGTYSLSRHAPDEAVTHDFLVRREADLVVYVLDALHLERGLCLARHLLDLNMPMVVALTFTDMARRRGVQIDVPRLARALGCPVVPIVGGSGQGLAALIALLQQQAAAAPATQPPAEATPLPVPDIEAAIAATDARLAFARALGHAVTQREGSSRPRRSDRADRILLSSWAGVPIFLGVMYLVFWLTVKITQPLVDFIDGFFGAFLVHGLRAGLEPTACPAWLVAAAADGAGAGLVAVATFIPPIFAIFLCLGQLEGSGYMPRAAFLMDRLLRRIGLPGKAFIPLLVGFGCSVPALLATRTLEARRDRVLTMLLTPLMSCGARLPVYTVFAVAFFPQHGSRIVFALYAIGIGLAVLSGLLLHRTILRGEAAPYVLELPPYQMPPWRQCLDHAWHNLRSFLVRAGKVIVGVAVALSLLNSAGEAWLGRQGASAVRPRPAELLGRSLAPVAAPMGIEADNWPAAVSLLTGLLAKEAVIGTLDVLYVQADSRTPAAADRQASGLRATLAHAFQELGEGYGLISRQETPPLHGAWPGMMDSMRRHFGSGAAAFAFLLFVLIYSPCLAATAVLASEAGWRWAAFGVSYQTLLAWLVATAWYQSATWQLHPAASSGWLAVVAAAILLLILVLRGAGRRMAELEIAA